MRGVWLAFGLISAVALCSVSGQGPVQTVAYTLPDSGAAVINNQPNAALDIQKVIANAERERTNRIEQQKAANAQTAAARSSLNTGNVIPRQIVLTTAAQQRTAASLTAGQLFRFLYIGPTEVTFNNVVYPIVNNRITVDGLLYVVCGLGIALDNTFICCDGNLFNVAIGPIECCGPAFRYVDREFCCGDNFFPNTVENQQLACCNNDLFQINVEYCCNNALQQIPCFGSCTEIPFVQFCCNGQAYGFNSGFRCCNNQIYSTSSRSCCNGVLINGLTCPNRGCIGVDPATQFCCNGQIFQSSLNQRCCNNGLYNLASQACCDNQILNLELGQRCCMGKPYNLQSQRCCGTNVVNGLICTNLPVCLADPATQFCCNNQVYQLASNQRCCKNVLYNVNTQTCCGDQIRSNSVNERCCINVPYNTRFQSCCNGRLSNDLTCNPIPVCLADSSTHFCCNSLVYQLSSNRRCCKNVLYNVNTQTCCGDQIRSKTANEGCCVNVPYNTRFQSCCNGRLSNSLTCNSATVCFADPATQFCCNNQVYQLASNQRCCRNVLYNVNSQTCCGDQIQSNSANEGCCINVPYNTRFQSCCNGRISNSLTCNSATVCFANPATQFCCNNQVYQLASNQRCCRNVLYNVNSQTCCGDQIQSNSVNEGCCINVPYNTRFQSCCNGRISNSLTCNSATVCFADPATQFCCNNQVYQLASNQRCCRNVLYNVNSQTCCGDQIQSNSANEGCCINVPYNTRFQSCCNGRISNSLTCNSATVCFANPATQFCCNNQVYQLASNQRCCRNVLYNVNSQTCCGDQIQSNSANEGCCINVPYNTRFQSCCNGRISNSLTCNSATVCFANPATQFCCNNQVYQLASNQRCCRNVLYNVNSQTCCGDQIRSNSANEGCCINVPYNTRFQSCCNGRISNSLTCNSATVCFADPATQFCCNNQVYQLASNQRCCRNVLYNVNTQTCCGDQIRSNSVNEGCCTNAPFDTRFQSCCCDNIQRCTIVNSLSCNAGTGCNAISFLEFCCNGQVYPLASSQRCCRNVLYDRNTHSCCNDVIVTGQSCGPVGLPCNANPTRQFCCGSLVVENDSEFGCCGGRLYIKESDICCNDKRFPNSFFCCLNNRPTTRAFCPQSSTKR